jgi:hypothetical protein
MCRSKLGILPVAFSIPLVGAWPTATVGTKVEITEENRYKKPYSIEMNQRIIRPNR